MPTLEDITTALNMSNNMRRASPGHGGTGTQPSNRAQGARGTPRKRRTSKCHQCRKDKKRCLPCDQANQKDWLEGKCERCCRLGHDCSVKRIAHDDPEYKRASHAKRSRRDYSSDESSPEDGNAGPSRGFPSFRSEDSFMTGFTSSQETMRATEGVPEDLSILDDVFGESAKWKRHREREDRMNAIVSELSPCLSILRETRLKCQEHKPKPSFKISDCADCKLMMTLSRPKKVLTLISQLENVAKEAIDDEDHSQAELLLVKARSARFDWCRYGLGQTYEDDAATVITMQLIQFYQKQNRHSEAEIYLEMLAKREKGSPSLSREAAQQGLVQSLKRTTDNLNAPMMDYQPIPGVGLADLGDGMAFPLFWRAYSRKVHLPLPDVDRNILDTHGNTALHEAIRHGSLRAVQELVTAGMNVLSRNNDHQTPLEVACIVGSLSVVEFLLKYQQDVDQRGQALDDEVYAGSKNTGIMNMLEPNLWGSGFGESSRSTASTPLHSAIENRRPDIVQCLLKYGATVNKIRRPSDSMSAIDLAQYMDAQSPETTDHEERRRSSRIYEMVRARNESVWFDAPGTNFLDALDGDLGGDEDPFRDGVEKRDFFPNNPFGSQDGGVD